MVVAEAQVEPVACPPGPGPMAMAGTAAMLVAVATAVGVVMVLLPHPMPATEATEAMPVAADLGVLARLAVQVGQEAAAATAATAEMAMTTRLEMVATAATAARAVMVPSTAMAAMAVQADPARLQHSARASLAGPAAAEAIVVQQEQTVEEEMEETVVTSFRSPTIQPLSVAMAAMAATVPDSPAAADPVALPSPQAPAQQRSMAPMGPMAIVTEPAKDSFRSQIQTRARPPQTEAMAAMAARMVLAVWVVLAGARALAAQVVSAAQAALPQTGVPASRFLGPRMRYGMKGRLSAVMPVGLTITPVLASGSRPAQR